MLKWWIAAERAIETSQNNLAHILDQGGLDRATCARRLPEGSQPGCLCRIRIRQEHAYQLCQLLPIK